MNYMFLACLLVSHGLATLPFFKKLRSKQMPSVVDFVPLSFFLYYDMGISLEVFGFAYENTFFPPFLSKPDIWTSYTSLIILTAPWVLRFGAFLSASEFANELAHKELFSYLRPDRVKAFYILSSLISIVCALWGIYIMILNPAIWISRASISAILGPYIIVLYLPMFVLAYFIQQRDIKPYTRNLYILFLVVCSVLSTLPVGERTNVLLPFLIVALFYKQLSIKAMAMSFIACAVAAALFLPLFKPDYSDIQDNRALIDTSVNGDFSRSQVLLDVVSRSPLFGTRILPYSGSGYIYSLFFFAPRSLASFKGNSTAVEYTAAITSTPTSDTNWGFGIGMMEEIDRKSVV